MTVPLPGTDRSLYPGSLTKAHAPVTHLRGPTACPSAMPRSSGGPDGRARRDSTWSP